MSLRIYICGISTKTISIYLYSSFLNENTRSLKYHLVGTLGARIDVIQLKLYILSYTCCHCLKKQLMTSVFKWDKTSGLGRNDGRKWSRLRRTLLIRKGSVKCGLLLLWAHLKISCISRVTTIRCMMCVKQQTDSLYIIICVVINCGWNNNVAIQIFACWNWNVFTSSSWLDRHGEFVFTIHVRRNPPHSNSPVRSSILWVRV